MKKILFLIAAAALNLSCGNVLMDEYNERWGTVETYNIGDTGPAGGFIFHIVDEGNGLYTYYEAAPASTEWTGKQWGKIGTPVSGTGTAIGTGRNNTNLIVAKLSEAPADSDRAAQLAAGLSYGGYSDWYLPSLDELEAIEDNLYPAIGSFHTGNYWSSSEIDDNRAYAYDFSIGNVTFNKDVTCRVRAVRSFTN